jgi:hypothetical protein
VDRINQPSSQAAMHARVGNVDVIDLFNVFYIHSILDQTISLPPLTICFFRPPDLSQFITSSSYHVPDVSMCAPYRPIHQPVMMSPKNQHLILSPILLYRSSIQYSYTINPLPSTSTSDVNFRREMCMK